MLPGLLVLVWSGQQWFYLTYQILGFSGPLMSALPRRSFLNPLNENVLFSSFCMLFVRELKSYLQFEYLITDSVSIKSSGPEFLIQSFSLQFSKGQLGVKFKPFSKVSFKIFFPWKFIENFGQKSPCLRGKILHRWFCCELFCQMKFNFFPRPKETNKKALLQFFIFKISFFYFIF